MDIPIYPAEDAPTRLVNLQHFDDDDIDVYIGSENQMYNFDDSPHHNPYKISEYGRMSAIEHYEVYLYERYLEDDDYREQVHNLHGQLLGCWCYPQHCHGEILIDLIEAWDDGGYEGALDYIANRLPDLDEDRLGLDGLKHRAEVADLLEDDPTFDGTVDVRR